MKISKVLPFAFLILFGINFQSCVKDQCTETVRYTLKTPIFQTLDELRITLEAEAPRELKRPGKIFFIDNFIFLNEKEEGIHVIDNSDPSNPTPISFINIPGNVDIAAKGNILYADNAVDLVTFDVSDPGNAVMLNRVEDVFPADRIDQDGRIAVSYIYEDIEEEMPCNADFGSILNQRFVNESFDLASPVSSTGSNSNDLDANGVAGSQSRFGLAHNRLYAVSEFDMRLFDLSTPEQPTFESSIPMSFWGGIIETIFPHNNHLFIGTSSGMLIYENSDPSNPQFVSSLVHATGCDPVYVKDNFAYVTLRSGTACNGFTNQLDLIDISDINNPVLKESFKMDNPHGLSIFGETLFVCEGKHGMKIFDISNPLNLGSNRLAKIKDFFAYDVITIQNDNQNVMMVVGEDGFYQYNFDDVNSPKLLSQITVEK